MFGFIKPFWKDLVPEFYNYFEEYYFNENYSGWQSYIKDRIPSTNNALEHFNRIIKMDVTNYHKLPFGEFLEKTFEFVNEDSKNQEKLVFPETTDLPDIFCYIANS